MTMLTITKAKDGGYIVVDRDMPLSESMLIGREYFGVVYAGNLDECLCYMRRQFDPRVPPKNIVDYARELGVLNEPGHMTMVPSGEPFTIADEIPGWPWENSEDPFERQAS